MGVLESRVPSCASRTSTAAESFGYLSKLPQNSCIAHRRQRVVERVIRSRGSRGRLASGATRRRMGPDDRPEFSE